jgi:hypothetical protein
MLKDESAIAIPLRIWSHCQQRRTDKLPDDVDAIGAISRRDMQGKQILEALLDSGFVERKDGHLIVHDFSMHNAKLIANWENGKRAKRRGRTAEANGSQSRIGLCQREATGKPTEANHDLATPDQSRVDQSRVDQSRVDQSRVDQSRVEEDSHSESECDELHRFLITLPGFERFSYEDDLKARRSWPGLNYRRVAEDMAPAVHNQVGGVKNPYAWWMKALSRASYARFGKDGPPEPKKKRAAWRPEEEDQDEIPGRNGQA